jgi:hypothetical protein
MVANLKKQEEKAFDPSEYADSGWIITKDYFPSKDAKEGTNCNAKGVNGPRDIAPDILKMLQEGKGRSFKMYSDDGELTYDGKIIVREDINDMTTDSLSEEYFRPLWDFGSPNAGCTYIKYKEKGKEGKWKIL